MSKVRCIVCGDTGFTASPGHVSCKCGGKYEVVAEDVAKDKKE